MTRVLGAVPVLPVLDVVEAMERFRLLGFDVVVEPGEAAYAIVGRDDVTLHLAQVPSHPEDGDVAIYLHVEDADALHDEWRASGVAGRFSPPVDLPWGMREATYIDPDGLLFRIGSRVVER